MTIGKYNFKTYIEIYMLFKDMNNRNFTVIIEQLDDDKLTYVGILLSGRKYGFKINNKRFDINNVTHHFKNKRNKLIIKIPAIKKGNENVSSSKNKTTINRRNDIKDKNEK